MSKTKWYAKPVYLLVALALVLSLGIVAVPMAGTVEAQATLTVDDDWQVGTPPYAEDTDGDDDFATIQAAIDAASPGDTIIVAAGTYNPTSTILIDKDGLILQGPQADVDPRPSYGSTRTAGSASEAVIDGSSGNLDIIIRIFADDVVINGFEIRSGTGDLIFSGKFGAARHINRPSVKYNIIHDSSKDECVQLKGAVYGVYEYNHVFDTGGDGLNFAEDGDKPTQHCQIRYNEIHDIGWYTGTGVGPSHGGIFVYNDGYGDLDVEIRGNLIYDINTAGIKFGDCGDWAFKGGEIIDNIIRDTVGVGVRVRASYTTVEGNEISRTGGITVESGVQAGTVLIQFNSIQGNTFGVKNTAKATVDATHNWWGDASGPHHPTSWTHMGSPYGPNDGKGDEVSDYVLYDPWLEALPMSKFVIDHAKIDFKKKVGDDKVRVSGKLELGANSNGVEISEDVIVMVGTLSETINMVAKGKKGEKWEYKRPKGGEGNIKNMTIDWKKGKFDVRMDKADLSGISNPLTISIQIGDDFGEETITMREKKHHWDYKAK